MVHQLTCPANIINIQIMWFAYLQTIIIVTIVIFKITITTPMMYCLVMFLFSFDITMDIVELIVTLQICSSLFPWLCYYFNRVDINTSGLFLKPTGWAIGDRNPGRAKRFLYSPTSVQTGAGAHQLSYSMIHNQLALLVNWSNNHKLTKTHNTTNDTHAQIMC